MNQDSVLVSLMKIMFPYFSFLSVNFGFILVCLGFYLFCFFEDYFDKTEYNCCLMLLGAKYLPYIQKGEYFRLLTPIILHGNFMHLLMNMISISMIGFACDYHLGLFWYLIFLALTGIGGNICSCVFMSKCGISIGASSSIMGILAFTIVFFAVNPELTSTNRMCYFVYLLVFAAAQIFGD